MKKVLLTLILVAPFVVFGGLYAFMRQAAAATRERDMQAAAAMLNRPAVIMINGVPVTNGPEARKPEQNSGQATGGQGGPPAGAGPSANMVRPESLEQGYILVVKDLAGLASPASPIYLASSFNGWDPGDAKHKLTSRSDLRWQIVMPRAKAESGMSFKFTRGNWDKEELDTALQPISNRSLPLVDASKLKPGEQPIFEFEIPKWGDQRPSAGARPDLDPYHELKVKGNAKRLQVSGGGVPMLRDVIVWLPPGYDDPINSSRTYQVLYLQDGQNVFEHLPSVPGEWKVDESAEFLMSNSLANTAIIVGIPHAGKLRTSEYSPVPFVDGAPPRAKEYVEFLVTEVMPRVEKAFRVRDGAEHCGIGGSSLGALVALYAAGERPDKFGKLMMESLAGLGERRQAFEVLAGAKSLPGFVSFATGSLEAGKDPKDAGANRVYGDNALAFIKLLKEKAGPQARVRAEIVEGDTHTEEVWARRFPEAFKFLYPKYMRD
ncbi:MAG: alpha/beta hydrolase [Phycisphaerales bacterium]